MAITLTPEEQAQFNSKTTNKPAKVETPTIEELKETTKTPEQVANEAIKVEMPSGLQQEIDQLTTSITQMQQDIINYQTEISTQTKIATYYHNIIESYEEEIKFSSGPAFPEAGSGPLEKQKWQLINISEDRNVHKNQVAEQGLSAYYPEGFKTSTIKELDADSPNTTQTYSNNLLALAQVAQSKIDYFRNTYSNAIRQNDSYSPQKVSVATANSSTDGAGNVINTTTYTYVTNPAYTTYLNKKAEVLTAVTNTLAPLNSIKSILSQSPYPDDITADAAQKAAAQLSHIDDYFTRFTNIKNASFYSDAILSNIPHSFTQNVITPQIITRISEIATLKKADYYTIRKKIALSLVKMGDGVIYKKFSAISTKASTEQTRDSKIEELQAYQSTGL